MGIESAASSKFCADGLGIKAREGFGCRREQGRYLVPIQSIIRDVLVGVDPG